MYRVAYLIVEDDEAIVDTLAYNLSRNGFGVQRATNGADALRLARNLRTNLILLDVMRSVLPATPDSKPLLVRARTCSRRP
jgi:DNA-binding response OmpR family regulator